MTGRAALDSKVHHELDDCGAQEDTLAPMDELVKDYAERGERLTEMGFNDEILNLKPRKVVVNKVPESKVALVKQLVKKKMISKAGGLYQSGVINANCQAVLEGARQI